MKKDIHPAYKKTTFRCACGHTFETGTTLQQDEVLVEVCSECHPFYTGKGSSTKVAGQVDKFRSRQAKKASAKAPAK